MTTSKFIGSSVILFIDNIIVAAGNWLFWIIVSIFTLPSSIGQATTIISLVTLFATVTQLGMEYPLLKRTSQEKSKIVGPTLFLALGFMLISIPFLVIVLNSLDDPSLKNFAWIAIIMAILYPVDFVSRYSLLGISKARIVLMVDSIGIVIKFSLGYLLVIQGSGALGILLAVFSNMVLLSVLYSVMVKRLIGFRPIVRARKIYKIIISEGLVNTPAKLSGLLIFSLSVVLLASFGVDSSEIGRFYIALMISIVGGGFLTSMAYMVIPASSESRSDMSGGGLRIGISLTAPIITILIVSPALILSVIGPEYVSAANIMKILALGILPFSVVMTSISKYNYLGKSRRIILLGSFQMVTFVLSFFVIVPLHSTLGAAYSILIAFLMSFSLSLFWIEKTLLKYILNTVIAILGGAASGYALDLVVHDSTMANVLIPITAVAVTSALILALRNTSLAEISYLIKSGIRR